MCAILISWHRIRGSHGVGLIVVLRNVGRGGPGEVLTRVHYRNGKTRVDARVKASEAFDNEHENRKRRGMDEGRTDGSVCCGIGGEGKDWTRENFWRVGF